MKKLGLIPVILTATVTLSSSQIYVLPGYEERIRNFVDSLKVVDTHEHFLDPELLKQTTFLDFSLLFQQNSYDALISAGMPATLFRKIYLEPTPVQEKWKIIEPYWKKSFNTVSNRILKIAINDLYGINDLNSTTVGSLSTKIRQVYSPDWFSHVLKDLCRIEYVIEDYDYLDPKYDFVRYAKRFSSWLTLRSKYRIDSLAVIQVEPIYTLEDYVKSVTAAFEAAMKKGMVTIKINVAYKRSLNFEKVTPEAARKVFRTLINGNQDLVISSADAKPLQDYIMFRILDLARKHKMPVAFHTGIQAGGKNILANSDPRHLVNLFSEYPDVKFVLFHGSYPFGGELTTLVRNYTNVYIDMNWTYSISPAYAERYLHEWLEAVPVSKIMAFGGDQRCVENTYGNLVIARQIISDVLIGKVKTGYFSENEAYKVAKMILYDNAVDFYNLK